MSASQTVLPEKATHQQTRTFNQQLVLRALHDDSPLSRADLARLTGLTRTSVSGLVGSLIDDDLIEEIGRGRSNGGKTPILLRVAPDGRHLIGLDLGEAQFSGAVVNLRGEILRSIHLPLEGRNGDAAVELVFQLVDAVRADDRSPLLGIGIGAPGIIDTSTGTVRWSVNLNWAELSPRAAPRAAVWRAGRRRQRQSRCRPRRVDLLSPPAAEQPDRDQGGSRGRRRDHPQWPAVPGRRVRRRRARPRLDRQRRRPVPLRADGLPRDDDEHARVGRRRWRRSSLRSPTRAAWWPPSWPASPASGGSSSMPRASLASRSAG